MSKHYKRKRTLLQQIQAVSVELGREIDHEYMDILGVSLESHIEDIPKIVDLVEYRRTLFEEKLNYAQKCCEQAFDAAKKRFIDINIIHYPTCDETFGIFSSLRERVIKKEKIESKDLEELSRLLHIVYNAENCIVLYHERLNDLIKQLSDLLDKPSQMKKVSEKDKDKGGNHDSPKQLPTNIPVQTK